MSDADKGCNSSAKAAIEKAWVNKTWEAAMQQKVHLPGGMFAKVCALCKKWVTMPAQRDTHLPRAKQFHSIAQSGSDCRRCPLAGERDTAVP